VIDVPAMDVLVAKLYKTNLSGEARASTKTKRLQMTPPARDAMAPPIALASG
jgi:hypothetical protein